MGNEHIKFIDLGLPSGTLWADRNLGADAPEDSGDYFRFGETTPVTEHSPKYVYDDINESIAGTDRDAATVNLGKNYRLPTFEQIKELLDECKWQWIKQNIRISKGMKVTGPNGNSIFFPAAGFRNYNSGSLNNVGSTGSYWSATASSGTGGRSLIFRSGGVYWGSYYRSYGYSVRAVLERNVGLLTFGTIETIKNCTGIKQSKRLIELGLDQATADYAYIGEEGPFVRSSAVIDNWMTPAWSLSALLELLPSGTVFLSRYTKMRADYRGHDGENEIVISTGAHDTYLDAVYNLVATALMEGYIQVSGNNKD